MIGTLGHSGAARVLVVVAHPDDETFGTGSLLLHLAAAGMTTAVCCASRGEAGDVRAGVSIPAGGVAALREAELRDAASLLGVQEIFLLDLLDSGMTDGAPTGSIVAVPFTEVVRRVSQSVATFRPDAVVTLDGADGHRDHVRMRDAAVAVGAERGIPVWLQCLPRQLMRRWAERLADKDPGSPYLALADLGTPDDLITERIDTERHYTRRLEAIARHRSQVSPYEALPEDLRRAFLSTDHLRAVEHSGMPADPDRARHQHHRTTCYWDVLECRWTCHEPSSTTGPQVLSSAPAE